MLAGVGGVLVEITIGQGGTASLDQAFVVVKYLRSSGQLKDPFVVSAGIKGGSGSQGGGDATLKSEAGLTHESQRSADLTRRGNVQRGQGLHVHLVDRFLERLLEALPCRDALTE